MLNVRCQNLLLEELNVPVYLHWERTLESLPPFSSRLCHVPFLFANFVLFPFSVLRFSHEYKYMHSPLSPPRELLNLGVALRVPDKGSL